MGRYAEAVELEGRAAQMESHDKAIRAKDTERTLGNEAEVSDIAERTIDKTKTHWR